MLLLKFFYKGFLLLTRLSETPYQLDLCLTFESHPTIPQMCTMPVILCNLSLLTWCHLLLPWLTQFPLSRMTSNHPSRFSSSISFSKKLFFPVPTSPAFTFQQISICSSGLPQGLFCISNAKLITQYSINICLSVLPAHSFLQTGILYQSHIPSIVPSLLLYLYQMTSLEKWKVYGAYKSQHGTRKNVRIVRFPC